MVADINIGSGNVRIGHDFIKPSNVEQGKRRQECALPVVEELTVGYRDTSKVTRHLAPLLPPTKKRGRLVLRDIIIISD